MVIKLQVFAEKKTITTGWYCCNPRASPYPSCSPLRTVKILFRKTKKTLQTIRVNKYVQIRVWFKRVIRVVKLRKKI